MRAIASDSLRERNSVDNRTAIRARCERNCGLKRSAQSHFARRCSCIRSFVLSLLHSRSPSRLSLGPNPGRPSRYASGGTPRDLVTRLNREIDRILRTDEARKVIAAVSAEQVSASPEEFERQLRHDRQRFGAIIREANIHAD